MNKKLLEYIRKYYAWDIPGKASAMQLFRAAYFPLNEKWPDFEEIRRLQNTYSSEELSARYFEWEEKFESLAQAFYDENRNTKKFNFCPACNEIARSPTFERCDSCDSTWTLGDIDGNE